MNLDAHRLRQIIWVYATVLHFSPLRHSEMNEMMEIRELLNNLKITTGGRGPQLIGHPHVPVIRRYRRFLSIFTAFKTFAKTWFLHFWNHIGIFSTLVECKNL